MTYARVYELLPDARQWWEDNPPPAPSEDAQRLARMYLTIRPSLATAA